MTKIYGLIVTKNEADKYLKPVLKRFLEQVDEVLVVDDNSTDDTVKICHDLGAKVWVNIGTSFAESESEFRTTAMETLKLACSPEPSDWICVIDADEFLCSDNDVRFALNCAIGNLGPKSFKVAEVFEVKNAVPYVRIDGFWKDITAPRLFNWGDYGHLPFNDSVLGCGSIPWEASFNARLLNDPVILHYGYAKEEDRVKKYARYFGRPGHNIQHIDSILRPPTLVRWDGASIHEYEDE